VIKPNSILNDADVQIDKSSALRLSATLYTGSGTVRKSIRRTEEVEKSTGDVSGYLEQPGETCVENKFVDKLFLRSKGFLCLCKCH